MADLNLCVKAILCGLARPVILALSGIIEAQIGAITAQLAAISALLVVVNIATIPIVALQDLAQVAVDEATSVLNLVPLSIMTGCADLGQAMIDINSSINTSLAAANNLLTDVNRKLSFKAELEDAQVALADAQARLKAISSAIQEALTPTGCM
jgi:hypothetical protein